jgi:hypothetical protein
MRRLVPLVAALIALAWLAPATLAADVTMTARSLAGGNVRVGAWSAIEVDVANDGPAVSGELRLASDQAASSSYAALVDLPTGSRKRYVLYAQPSIFGRDLGVTLVSDGRSIAKADVPITAHDQYQSVIGVVAEEPGPLVAALTSALADPRVAAPAIVSLTPEDLPARVEAWSAIDRLVWQDVDTAKLQPEQVSALRTWLGLGGRLVILGGSTGATTLGSLPDDLLPYRPTGTVDATPQEVDTLISGSSDLTHDVPALGGTLIEGSVIGRAGDSVIAAERTVGQGRAMLIGIDPTADGIAGTPAAQALWRRAMPLAASPVVNPLALPDDSGIVGALNNLPAVGLPPLEQLAGLLVAYIVLIGPINYLVLRRLDRREWAWVTMPVLIVVFSVGAFGLGRVLKGSDTIVNTIAIVRGAAGAESGLGQVYVGVFSPSRRTFDVRVGGGALLSNPISIQQQGVGGAPLDILLGDPAVVRGYAVGFGSLRGFRAEAALPVPKVEAVLKLREGRLDGTVTNASDETVEDAALIYGGSLAKLGDLAPGASAKVSLALGSGQAFGASISDRMFGAYTGGTTDRDRTITTRRAVIDQLTQFNGRFSTLIGAATGQAPALVGWRPGGSPLTVDIGDEGATHVGDAIYVLPLGIDVGGRTTFPDELISHTVVTSDAAEGFDQGNAFSLSRGSMVVDFAPIPFDGAFVPTRLSLSMTPGDPGFLAGQAGASTGPLPDDQQPDQDDPVGEAGGAAPLDGMPDIQLFDRTSGRWMEFAHMSPGTTVSIAEPERYVDSAGHLLARFVSRLAPNNGSTYFSLATQLDGSLP